MWMVSFFIILTFAGAEVAIWFCNKAVSTPTGLSVTNIEVAFVTVLGWWYNALAQDAIFIKQKQEKVVQLGLELRNRQLVKTVDTSHKIRLVYFCSANKYI